MPRAKAVTIDEIGEVTVEPVVELAIETEAPAAPVSDLQAEADRLLAGGDEGEYTLVPTFAAADNHLVEPTDVTVSVYTLCRKKA